MKKLMIIIVLVSSMFVISCGCDDVSNEAAQENNDDIVRHIYVIEGQSNTVGQGGVAPMSREINENVMFLDLENELQVIGNTLYSNGNNYEGDLQNPDTYSFGISFADAMIDRFPEGDEIVIVHCARGLTRVEEHVDEGYDFFGLYHERGIADICMERVNSIMNNNSKLEGVIYHQGESDYIDVEHWKEGMIELIQKWKNKYGEIDFVFAQIGDLWEENETIRKNWEIFKDAQEQFSIEYDLDMIFTDDLELYDGIHLNSESLKEVGERFADAI